MKCSGLRISWATPAVSSPSSAILLADQLVLGLAEGVEGLFQSVVSVRDDA